MTFTPEVNLPRRLFITGTDTGVGKTVVTAALALCLRSLGKKVKVLKPIQTGTELPGITDLEFVYKVLGEDFDIESQSPIRLKKPLSPLTASEFESVNIDTDLLKSLIEIQSADSEVTLIEGAGGVLVPIKNRYFMSDLVKDLNLDLLIVLNPRLGTINHTLLTIEHVKSKGIKIFGLVFSNFPETPNLAESTNPKVIKQLSGEKVVGVVPNIEGLDVDKGKIGAIRKNFRDYFIPHLGGNLSIDKYLV